MSAEPLSEVLARLDGVEGWLSDEQAEALYELAAACRRGDRIVEIGSFRGRSTIVLASAAPDGVEIVAIDPHAGNDRGPQEIIGFEQEAQADRLAFERNLTAAGVRQRVQHVRAFSDDAHGAVDDPIRLLYIDAAHRFGPARADISDWGSRVSDGGTLAIHDSFSSIGVTGAIVRELMLGRRFRFVRRTRSLAIYRADLRRGPWPRLANAGRQFIQLGWFARNLALKVALSAGLGTVARRLGRDAPDWPY
ncbi:MAG: class I SAM-dependent methyltransferase [Actinomycetota bacterium]|nr:class I SAM-dependent methyltransferase [Actinomycetota bacterium]